ncbi:alpha-L-rhamnosidase [Deminuibacter soli]|uniref:alpha-L-rhamnosidase n=1 Tax=Deminuibacter soli TaxID=2291815 RepID=A0A3E1NRE5_9BACT|nr:alpha-L-rhamnosidase [Deminuibacter soli]RFM30529.1 alpha-rhamnosidase [Deminuibacter soli]
MTKRSRKYSAAWIAACLCIAATAPVHAQKKLKCEYLENPLGIDATHPRFSWQLDDATPGATQTAWRILVSTDSAGLANDQATVWNSGWQQSGAVLAVYNGAALQPFTRYFWKVSTKSTQTTTSSIASFETGMMDKKNWQGAWISDGTDINLKPAPYFRKVFTAGKKIKHARAYIAAAGLYELYINGEKIGNHRLDPMYTRFDRRTLYVTYDVTQALQNGANAIGVLLGNGWYNMQSTAVWNFHKAPWRNRPAFCFDLRITYEDDSVETIASGKDWKTALSPVVFNSIYTAEHYDARKEQPGWNTIHFADSSWKEVYFRTAPAATITAQAMHPVRNVEEVKPQTIKQLDDTTWLFDLGRNIAGVSRITVQGPAGTVVRIKHTERLYANGRADMSNIDVHYRPTDNTDPFQTDMVILNGKDATTFMPHFNYKGFQYIEVSSSAPVKLTKESVTAYFMHSDVPAVGEVSSSDDILTKIWSATNNSYLSNLFGYPTDCPQREKNGWTGDAQIAIETGLYSFDGITVYEKWLADHRDEQQPNGVLPSIVPTDGWGYEWGNGPDWTSTIAIIPWNIYLFYGDTTLLANCYDNIKRYVEHINLISPAGLTTWGLGDWVPVKSTTPVELTSTCYYYADVLILAKAAKLFGHTADELRYNQLAAKIRDAFNTKYLHTETATYGDGVQTALSTPLYWGLVPDAYKAKVAASLAKKVASDNYHLDVGLLGQKAILNALSENGYADVAYKIASQKTYPSWGWWMVNGATTLYENWKIDAQSDISLNHIMFGEIGAWLYKGIAGIKPDAAQPGFKNTVLQPHFVEGLNSFEAKHESPYGTIVSSWVRKGNAVAYTVVIPSNATASLYLPGYTITENGKQATGNVLQLQAGTHNLVCKMAAK